MINKEILKSEFTRLCPSENINDSIDLINIYSNCLYQIILNQEYSSKTSFEADAKIVLQMIFTKTLTLRNNLDGIRFKDYKGNELNEIIDPTLIVSMVRNIYETVGMFNLIYNNTKTEDEKLILYNLWAHAGLSYRQRFEPLASTNTNNNKLEHEKKQIEILKNQIKETDLYKNLDVKNQAKIDNKLRDKDYLIHFSNDKVVRLSWQKLTEVMGIKDKFSETIYTYFSLLTHPSNVSIIQFRDMFDNKKSYLDVTNTNIRYVSVLVSIFIHDYIKLFPEVIDIYNDIPLLDQIVINFYNTWWRGMDVSINDSYKEME